MTVTVHSNQRNLLGQRLVHLGHPVDGLPIPIDVLGRNETFVLEELERLVAVGDRVELRSMGGGFDRTYIMDARDQSSQDGHLLVGQLVGGAAAGSGPDGVPNAFDLMQRVAVLENQGRTDRKLRRLQLEQKLVFLPNRIGAPAPRPVELGDDVLSVFELQVVDPVLHTVERHDVTRWLESRRLHRAQDPIVGQPQEQVAHLPTFFTRLFSRRGNREDRGFPFRRTAPNFGRPESPHPTWVRCAKHARRFDDPCISLFTDNSRSRPGVNVDKITKRRFDAWPLITSESPAV